MSEKYEIGTNDKVGRFMLAKVNLREGEEIFSEEPFSYGPKMSSALVCLGCHRPMDVTDLTTCTVCSWPVCGIDCERREVHKNNECSVFSKSHIKFNPNIETEIQFDSICPLRTLLSTERNIKTWETEISKMMAHTEKRKENTNHWNAEFVNVVKFIRDACKMNRFSVDLIHKVCGILEINCYEIISGGGSRLRGLYPKGTLMSHNCVANTTHTVFGEDMRMAFRTTIPVKAGSELYSSYTFSSEPTLIRRSKLFNMKHFWCDCPRCADPSELGTHLGTLKCTKCDPDDEAPWKCDHCENGVTASGVKKINSVIQEELEQLDSLDFGEVRVIATEKALENYKSVLHPKHAWNISLCQSLTQLYGRADGYTLNLLPDLLLERKAELCKKVLDVLDVIEPGMTRIRGITLYEYHVALLLYSKSRYQYNELNAEQYKEEMVKVVETLQASASILGHEPRNSTEGSIALAARQAMIQLQLSITKIR